ncbi:MAG: MFS transporter [Acidobacteria bacterium]|nr:MFS transporter [Acidobacteriota bacterium]
MSKPVAVSEPLASTPEELEVATEAAVPQGKLAKTFAAFTYRDFRLLWFGAFTSSAGTWLQEAALSWLLFSLTAKERYLGYNQFLSTAPILVFTLIGGVVADRIDKRRILLTSQWIQLGCALSLSVMAFAQMPAMVFVWTALALAVVTGCAQAFGGPAYQSLVPMLVEKKDLPNAISLNSIQFQLARTVGPMIGTLPFAWMAGNVAAANYQAGQMRAGGVSFAFNAFSFLAVIVSLSLLRVKTIPNAPTQGMRHAMSEGINFVRHQEALRSLTLLAFSCTFFGMQMTGFFPALAKLFQLEARGNATMLSVSGAGAVAGALVMASFGNLPDKGRRALMMQLAFGLTIIAFSFATNLWLAYAMIFLCGVFMMCVFASIASLVQLIVADEMRGRVMSIYMLAFRGGMPLGALLTGYLAEKLPLMQILRVQGIAVAALALVYLLSNSTVKKH